MSSGVGFVPLIYYNKQVISNFTGQGIDFASLEPLIVLYHPYYPLITTINIPNQLPFITNSINNQWNYLFADQSYNFVFNVIEIHDISSLPEPGLIQLQYIDKKRVPYVRTQEQIEDWNLHLCKTLYMLFSMCPRARVRILYDSDYEIHLNVIYFYIKIVDELQKPFYTDNDFIFFTNFNKYDKAPPPSDFQTLFTNITIPMFVAAGNQGWIINNVTISKNYEYLNFISKKICKVGSPNHSIHDPLKYYSSCGFLDPRTIPVTKCPEIVIGKDDTSTKQLSFLEYCDYALLYLEGFQLPKYQFPFQTNLPIQYKNQFFTPDVSEQGTYVFYDGSMATGTSYSVIMFSVSYAVIRMISGPNFIITESSSSTDFLSQMYNYQFFGKNLFQYDDSDKCQFISADSPPLIPSNINCRNYEGYVVEVFDQSSTRGLNVMGLGSPQWKNWIIKS